MSSNLQQQAFQAIRKQIIYAEIEPGSKISEKALEDALHIGRTPIREALIQLRNQELVYTVPQSGTYVSKIDIETASHASFSRKLLEKAVLVECSARMTEKAGQVLENVIEDTRIAAENRDLRKFFHLDNVFHKTCFDIAGKAEVWEWLESFSTHLDRFRWLRLNVSELRWERIIEEHEQLLQAIMKQKLNEVSFLSSMHLHMIIEEQDKIIQTFPDFFTQGSKIQ
ncbi:GntR family transcriptional regulator [Candidatus Enterococcus clewellii]|uniref:HTH gntR-type domain-containing protein n=1 Tax=Candidatus Enterococcus clewellii TaxID=1834193 RepID=A0A242K8X3_9ENTE|nr:GntR family transcriptional regulator [Enterococcus sp. 9E7_DIV0242]OTP17624.1 hypothetical protein A5888_001762 [Enterococcus sp. 9E7_DIV0242]